MTAAAIAFLIAAAAQADPVQPVDFTFPELSEMEAGRLLLRAGRLEHARSFLLQATPSGERERIERLFLLGRIEMRLGLPRQAARRFEAILAQRPDLTRARLELAAAYYAAERHDKARHHFEASLADRLPSSVEAEVRRFLDRIDHRKRWSATVSVALAPESNPARRSARETVRIGGVPFRLDERASSGTGALVSGVVSFSPRIDNSLHSVFAASGSAKLYRRGEWNDITIAGEAGLALPFERSSLSGGVRISRRRLGEDGYNRGIGPWMRGHLLVSDRIRLNLSLDVARIEHDDRPDRDGWRWVAKPAVLHALSSRSFIEAGLELEAATARTKRFGSRMAGLSLTFTHAFEGGFSVSPAFAVHQRRYRDENPLFGKTRTDTTIRPSLKVLHRSLQFDGFAPWVGYSFESNRSTIPINSYRNHAVLCGISQSF